MMTEKEQPTIPNSETAEHAGPVPTAQQATDWGKDYLWVWCSSHPKNAAAEIERLRTVLIEISRLDASNINWGPGIARRAIGGSYELSI